MRALQITEIGKPLSEHRIPEPTPAPGEIVVRVDAAGICRSDMHYRAGSSPVGSLPIIPGHEVAGTVVATGDLVSRISVNDRVCLHYLITCGMCRYCLSGNEQFCPDGQMIGKHRDGGYAEFIAVPEGNAIPLPASIDMSHGAILMCSSSTSYHAVCKSRLKPGETVAVFGAGGLGMSAIQIALSFGASRVFAVDIDTDKLRTAELLGAIPVDASAGDEVAVLHELTAGAGVDVSLELVGLKTTMRAAIESLGAMGRAAVAGILDEPILVDTYRELIGKEGEIIGVSDHHATDLYALIDLVQAGKLDLTRVVASSVSLDADAVNGVLDSMEEFSSDIRTVIEP